MSALNANQHLRNPKMKEATTFLLLLILACFFGARIVYRVWLGAGLGAAELFVWAMIVPACISLSLLSAAFNAVC